MARPVGVEVTVQWRGDLGRPADPEKRQAGLRERLSRAIAGIEDVAVDWNSVSALAQTVDAVVPASSADETIAELERRGLRVDRVVEQQII